jgi:hypothetical protein
LEPAGSTDVSLCFTALSNVICLQRKSPHGL